ncbi:hypothetical protein ACGFMK_17870 [Amycolatopsis sp. NPDC049252]|uniref:hypothetical protein n=1 Tax=Amycolatopsis sp. NPDC049252 TaxID=3363933 RepID=UPI003710B281
MTPPRDYLLPSSSRTPWPGDALRRFFHDHGRRAERLELAPIVLRAAQDHGARPAEALVHLSIGGAYFREGRHEEGIRHSAKAVPAGRACGWREREATAVAHLGSMLDWTGRLPEAVEHSRRAIQRCRARDRSRIRRPVPRRVCRAGHGLSRAPQG